MNIPKLDITSEMVQELKTKRTGQLKVNYDQMIVITKILKRLNMPFTVRVAKDNE